MFPGRADLEQVCLIFSMLGTPNVKDWPEVRRLPDYGKVNFAPKEPQPLPWEAQRSPATVRLLFELLRLNPSRRLPAARALEDPCFSSAPAAATPRMLVEGLSEEPHKGGAAAGDGGCSWGGSSGSCSFVGGSALGLDEDHEDHESSESGSRSREVEAAEVPVETTSCGLWDAAATAAQGPPPTAGHGGGSGSGGGAGAAAASPASRGRNRTPEPPALGEHRLKASVQSAYDDVPPAAVQPQRPRQRTPSPPRQSGAHRLKACLLGATAALLVVSVAVQARRVKAGR